MNGFRPACVLGAAAELDLWTVLGEQSLTAEQLADWAPICVRSPCCWMPWPRSNCSRSSDERYRVPPELRAGSAKRPADRPAHAATRHEHPAGLVAVGRDCRAGIPAPRPASIRGAEADRASFIAAMHSVSGPMADDLVARLGPPHSATCWTWAGPRARGRWPFSAPCPPPTATIFDLPDAIEQARAAAGRHGVRLA